MARLQLGGDAKATDGIPSLIDLKEYEEGAEVIFGRQKSAVQASFG